MNSSVRRFRNTMLTLPSFLISRITGPHFFCWVVAITLLAAAPVLSAQDKAPTPTTEKTTAGTEKPATNVPGKPPGSVPEKSPSAPDNVTKTEAEKCSIDQLEVIGIEEFIPSNPNGDTNTNGNDNNNASTPAAAQIALYHTIRIKIKNLPEWVKRECSASKFILYIDGNAFPGIKPNLVDNDQKLQFDLKRIPDNKDNKDAWSAVLSRRPKDWTRLVPVTVGLENGAQVSSKLTATLTVIDKFWFYIFVVSFLAAIAVFWFLAWFTDIIRDTGEQPEGTKTKGEKPNRKAYSLARTQMAFWFFIVVIAYVFIWMVTSDLANLTTSVLALIGISAATGLGSAVVDATRKSDADGTIRALKEKKTSDEAAPDKLQTEVKTLTDQINAKPTPTNVEELKAQLVATQLELTNKQKEINQTSQDIQKLSTVAKPQPSKNFIQDILSDNDGVSFHRFQIFAWTIVLICVFVVSVYNSLSMPDFDGTLLALMGISGGTYIGFKLPKEQG